MKNLNNCFQQNKLLRSNMTGTRYILTILLFAAVSVARLSAQACDCLTTGNCPVPIQDNGTFQGTLDVTVNGPNDLGQCPLTSVCFSITHTWVGDLCVTLTSPGGVNYMVMADANNGPTGCGTDSDNIDVCIVPGTGNPLTNNTEYMCNFGACQSGNCCLVGNWTMPCGGVTDPVTGAMQAPSCDLNDFNIPGSPANGTWTLTVNDICSQDIGTLNNFSLTFACGVSSCTVCSANGGDVTNPDFQGCLGDPALNFNIFPVYTGQNMQPNPAEYSYAWVVSQNGIIQSVNPTPNMSTQPPGIYTLCGFSYLSTASGQLNSLIGMDLAMAVNQFNSNTAPFCGDFSNDCMQVTIGPAIPPTFVNASLCIGDCIEVGGQPFCSSGSITLTSYLGCDSVVNVIVTPLQPSFSTQNVTVCQGDCITVNNQQYCPPGPVSYTLQNWQGCDSIVTIIFDEVITIAQINPAVPPPISCSNPVVTLDAFNSIPQSGIIHWTGPNNFTSNQPFISVNVPGTYTLTVTNNALNPPCVDQVSVVVTGDPLFPDLVLNGAPPVICLGDFLDLASLSIIDINGTNPTFTYHTGTPTTPANQLPNTTVSPTTTTTYYVRGTSGDCFDELPVTVTVNPAPVADFTVVSPICINGSSTVTFTGVAPPGAIYNWSFGGGAAVPGGSGPGPHSVTWGTGGTKTITLTVVSNNCPSNTATQTVEVGTQPLPPTINCSSTTSDITFSWDDVVGATGYNVTVVTGQPGIQVDPLTYLVANLAPNEEVTLSVEAVSGNPCPNSVSQITCTAQDCPPINVTIDPVPDICLAANTGTIQLVATQTGGSGTGTYTWSGPGVSATGLFDPAAANIGANTIMVSYEEGTCTYNKNVVIHVFAVPTADFSATSPICSSGSSTVTYTGSATNGANFTWDFDGGTASPTGGAGPLQVTWPASGSYTISLIVEENGCTSDTFAQTVNVVEEIEAPQITCVTTTNSIEFSWNNVPGASGYQVNVISGGAGTATSDTSMLFTGLSPGDGVTIEVVALDAGPCGDVSAQSTCVAQDCAPVTISITPVATICLGPNASPVTLEATATGGTGGGSFEWTGPGVSTAGVFDPQQAAIGANTLTATYTEGDCIYTKNITITVAAQPVAGFSVAPTACVNEDLTVSYTGSVSANMQFDWSFGSGTANPGTGQGPQQVSWPTAGQQVIALTVTSGLGCTSEPFTDTVQVVAPFVAPAITCVTTTSSIEFNWPDVPGATNYQATLLSGGPGGSQVSQNAYVLNGLNAGDQATIELTVSGNGPCPPVTAQQTCTAQDCPPVVIGITPVDDICLDANTMPVTLGTSITGGGTLSWSGQGVSTAGVFDPQQALIGANTLTASYMEGNCIYTEDIVINVFAQPVASFAVAAAVCAGDNTAVTFNGTAGTGATYDWDFGTGTAMPGTGVGPHQVSWANSGAETISLTVTSAQGCVSEPYSSAVQVGPPLIAPAITCNTTLNSIEFTWPDVSGATDYQVALISGATGSQTSQNTYLITGLSPNDMATIELTVSNAGPCPAVSVQETCTAQDCLPVVVSVDPVAPICLGAVASVQLSATITGNAGGGTTTWSGPGTSSSGVFTPATAGVGTHQITVVYEENNCTYQASTTIQVLPTPSANFSASANICVSDAATVTYAGAAPASATYTWDFGGGTATPGTGQGPHQVSFPAPGIYDISLTVTQAGCTSSQVVHSVQVDPELVAPDIDCNTTNASIEFTWPAVPNATDYQITVLSGATGSQNTPTSYLVNGLQPGDQVTIELSVSGNTACPPVTVQQTCTAQDCPPVTIDLTPVDPICLLANTGTVQLEAATTGGSGNGTGTWSGAGVNATGLFNPATAGVGNHVITYVYEENSSCSYDATMVIQIIAPPIADAGADGKLTCEPGETSVILGGDNNSAGPTITYSWSAATGSFPGDPNILHPEVAVAGNYTLTVTNTEIDGCSATDLVQVMASQDIPQIAVNITPISCYGENDGAISVASITGGTPPYLYALNGGAFASGSTFQPLAPGIYVVTVMDASGCEASLTVDMTQPQELNVELIAIIEGGGNIIRLGDTTELQALVTLPADSLDNISWYPKELVSCDSCLNTFVAPTGQTTFTVTVESNGCTDSDDLTIYVKKDHPIYVPNAFSPNDDGLNDKFMIYAGKEVTKIKSFLVFDRWGETMYQHFGFQPNDPTYGWDGTHRGELMKPAVFTWFAEVEFVDGSVELFEGDVTLMR
jgi:gliding motility-associated-like protein